MTSTFNASYSPKGRPFLEVCDALHTLAQASDITPNMKAITKCATRICKQPPSKNISPADLQNRIQKLTQLTQVDSKIKTYIQQVLTKLQNIQPKTQDPTPPSPSTTTPTILKLLQQLTQGIIKNPKYNTAPIVTQLTQSIHKLHSIQDPTTLNSIQEQLDLLDILLPSHDSSLEELLSKYTSAMTLGTASAHLTSSPIIPPKGIPNKGGNDCALIALCQMFKIKALREHLVDQLPDALWELIAAEHPDSSAIRTFLINNIKSFNTLNRYYQFDITEVLCAFLEATRCKSTPQTPAASTSPHTPTPQKVVSRFAKLSSMWKAFSNWIHHLILRIMGYANEPKLPVTPRAAPYYYKPDVSPARRATKAPKDPKNPLFMQINTHTSSSASPNSTCTDAVFHLPIHIKQNTNGISSFKESFKAHFMSEVIKNGDTVSRTFKQLPEYMLLSLERAIPTQAPDGTYLSQKNTDDVEDVDFIITLPPETLNDQDKNSGIQPKYELQSFICHLGNTTKKGHYVTYTKQSNGDWYLFNDNATPVKCTPSRVQAAATQASLVFYQRLSSSGKSSKKSKKSQKTK